MKLFNPALQSACLLICSLVIASLSLVMAAEAIVQETSPYQSTFDDYKPLANDSSADWKTINTQSSGSGHAGHSMPGMKDQMGPEDMAKMPSEKEAPANKSKPDMEGMNHGDIKAMDHSQMKQKKEAVPMEGMDHSKMPAMDHDNMRPLSDSKPAMQPMKQEDMSEMSRDKMAGHDHGGSGTKAMDHSKMSESKPDGMKQIHEDAAQDETQPHDHASKQEAENSGISMPSMASPTTQTTPWQVIPNYHPIIVHFPIALTIIAFLLSLAAYVRRSHPVSAQMATAGHFTLWLAAIGAAAAVLFGWLAFNSVNHDDAGHAAMLLHRSWAIPTAVGLILLASWDAWKYRVNELISVPMLFLLFLLAQAIAVTGWLGGEVVYRHGIGVLSLPSSEISEHGQHHEHGGKDAAEHAHGMSEDKADKKADERPELPTDEIGESHEH